ncbi:hypothetical protein NX059_005524 [Plenodomus lindquistii]|nr:hypothetical protein NX059_005524 [Plenodomus lindquistii]
MQFLTLAALFGAAIAAPAPQTSDCPNPAHCGTPQNPANYENIDISDYYLRKNNGVIQAVGFKLSGDNATDIACSVGVTPTLPTEVIHCADDKYKFVLTAPEGDENPGLTIYHETGLAQGKWGEGPSPNLYCRAGGNGPEDFICNQVSFYTLVITNGAQ